MVATVVARWPSIEILYVLVPPRKMFLFAKTLFKHRKGRLGSG